MLSSIESGMAQNLADFTSGGESVDMFAAKLTICRWGFGARQSYI